MKIRYFFILFMFSFSYLIDIIFAEGINLGEGSCSLEEQKEVADWMMNQKDLRGNLTYDAFNVFGNYSDYILSLGHGTNPKIKDIFK